MNQIDVHEKSKANQQSWKTTKIVRPAMFWKNIWENSSSFPHFNKMSTHWAEEPVCVYLQGDNIRIGLFQSNGKRVLQGKQQ